MKAAQMKSTEREKKAKNVNNSNRVIEISKEERVPIIIHSGLIVDVVEVDNTKVLFLQHVCNLSAK